ncbi:alpha/beta fold hydrolase [Micromonospora sp. NPDC001898]|uniref:alpha/beta fold hydrolase n=1 Tax=Micromonospora sp. NPDC001898 TaxID=3364221 RepID=UPI003673C780
MNASPTATVLRPLPGLDLNVRGAGHGEAVLILHGASGPDSIDTLLDHLSVGPRVLAPTQPGWGGTQRPDELIGDVLTPTPLVWGESDPVVSAGFGRAYADAVPNARFVLIPDAGHPPMREAPDETFVVIDAFLADETLTKD